MRMLFVFNRMAHVRHFDRAIRLLADRGHEIVLAGQDGDTELTDVLTGHPRISAIVAPERRHDDWTPASSALRRTRDFVRYLHPRYADAGLLRRRAFEKMAGAVSGRAEEIDPHVAELLRGMNTAEQKRLDAILAKLETAIPADPAVHAFVSAHQPGLLVLSPMVGVGFSQADFVKSARQLGIPSGVLVFSWDNLSNKGLLHETPDRMWVWNQTQRHEAATLHRYPAERVVVTGAPRFDDFFELEPAITREALCQAVGLDPARPLITYVCSSPVIAPREREFVPGWVAELRRSEHAGLAECNVIVRPHPAAAKSWFPESRSVVRWPEPATAKASATKPFDDPRTVVMSSPLRNADQVLWDTLHHSAAVVGLNTSAEIEAAIVGRPVYTLLDPNAEGQTGTLHFHYLLREQGGHVNFAASFAEHRAQLADALDGNVDRAALTSFLSAFVRPHGLDVPVSPIVADAVAGFAASTVN
jgi:hypothetical protein